MLAIGRAGQAKVRPGRTGLFIVMAWPVIIRRAVIRAYANQAAWLIQAAWAIYQTVWTAWTAYLALAWSMDGILSLKLVYYNLKYKYTNPSPEVLGTIGDNV